MTTKTPSSVQPADPSSMEALAYAVVEGIPTVEPHDVDRLGYCVYLFLVNRKDTLEQAIRSANARLTISEEEATRMIQDRLRQRGVSL